VFKVKQIEKYANLQKYEKEEKNVEANKQETIWNWPI